MFTLNLNALTEKNPRVIQPEKLAHNSESKYPEVHLTGTWYRVFPTTARDVLFLQTLIQHSDKFAPAAGHGIIIAEHCLPAK